MDLPDKDISAKNIGESECISDGNPQEENRLGAVPRETIALPQVPVSSSQLPSESAENSAEPASPSPVAQQRPHFDTARIIDEMGGLELEIVPDRTRDDIYNNRPGKNLRDKILALPEKPGVYMYLDKQGRVIYVGKAKRLKRRVSSYFNRRHDITRTNLMVRNIADMRFIVVASEEEALTNPIPG